jgi:hypothetical protein
MTDEEICGAKTSDGTPCQNPPMDNGRCYHHGGATEDAGAPEGNGNNAKHNLYSDPDKLYQRLDDDIQEHVDSVADSLATRYEHIHGREPDYAARTNIEQIAMDIVKVRLAHEYMAEEADESGNPLLETDYVEAGDEIREITRPNQLNRVLSDLKNETRQWLKDMGLLNDPESEKADAAASLVQMLSEEDT